jgi:phenylalanyl-tRNA synthetase beta chain
MLGTYGAGASFFSLKGELESVFSELRILPARYEADKCNPTYHPGRCAKVTVDGVDVGYIGQIHPLVAQNYGIDCEVYCAEINFSILFDHQLPEATYVPLPKFPTVTRDLAIVCDEEVTVADAQDVITAAAGKLLRKLRLFDVYRGAGIADGKKSLAFSLELRADDRTLTDTDSEQVIAKILKLLSEKLGTSLR